MTEAELLTEVLKLAKRYDVLAFHSTDSRRDRGDAGFPDLVLAGSNYVLFVELKTAIGRVKPGQTLWKNRLLCAGQAYALWRPEDLRSGKIEELLKLISPKENRERSA